MIKNFLPRKRDLIIASTTGSTMMLMPTAFASATHSYPIVLKIIAKLLEVFRYAGIVLLVYAVIALILAFKNEDAESKVNAITQVSIAIVLITLSSIIGSLMTAVGISHSIS